MNAHDFDTLSEALNALKEVGYSEDFVAQDKCLIIPRTRKEYLPDQLKITKSYRFEGISNPSDSSVLFAIITSDGIKGTLVMSYDAKHSQHAELIKQIKIQST